MKKIYNAPELDAIVINSADCIASSVGIGYSESDNTVNVGSDAGWI